MSGTRARIDPTEFVPASGLTKFICFLVISICIVYYVRTGIKEPIGVIMSIFMYILGIMLGIIGGFIGAYLGKVIQENVGSIAVYEKSVLDIFIRKLGMKVGPGLVGCVLGTFIGSYGLMSLFI